MQIQLGVNKANLSATKRSLAFADLGYNMLDRKKTVLMQEMMLLHGRVIELGKKISEAYNQAYKALQEANISIGLCSEVAMGVSEEVGLDCFFHSVMGIELPALSLKDSSGSNAVPYSLYDSDSLLDEAYLKFLEVKKLTIKYAEVESGIFSIANMIKKIKKRTNALKNLVIPDFKKNIKNIVINLEEKEREEFVRMKIAKSKSKF
ncbi:MAG: V-type ATP synthase subunit D [Oscillospiraceae bacterium]|nr:V-type ATP synthase subunit D [Oscillospiraceae bacterium]